MNTLPPSASGYSTSIDFSMDSILPAVMKNPGKVLDAVAAMLEHQDDLLGQLATRPLWTEADVRQMAATQGRVVAVQDLIQIFIGKILETEEKEDGN
jgi:hypothetical protein